MHNNMYVPTSRAVPPARLLLLLKSHPSYKLHYGAMYLQMLLFTFTQTQLIANYLILKEHHSPGTIRNTYTSYHTTFILYYTVVVVDLARYMQKGIRQGCLYCSKLLQKTRRETAGMKRSNKRQLKSHKSPITEIALALGLTLALNSICTLNYLVNRPTYITEQILFDVRIRKFTRNLCELCK